MYMFLIVFNISCLERNGSNVLGKFKFNVKLV